MIEPIFKDYNLYKGATFKIQFRIKRNGDYVDVSGYEWYFKAADEVNGTLVLEGDNQSSPANISVDADDDYLVTVKFSPTDTDAITQVGCLKYEIDNVLEDGERQRRMMGSINLYEDVESE